MKHANIGLIIKGSFLFILLGISFITFTNSTGPIPGNTNAPGETNCTSCHTGTPIINGNNWNNISLNIPSGGYVPGNTYNLTLTYTQVGIVKKGFQVTVLNSSNTMAGTLATSGSGVQVQTSGGRTYINHNLTGTTQSSWSFIWTAPNPGTGTVTFYVAMNAANNDNTFDGDQIYLKQFVVNQQATSGVPTAIITPSATSICLGDTLYLQGSRENNPTTYTWEFTGNDSLGSVLQNPKVVYTTTGTKTIKLTTSNEHGQSIPASININVNPLPNVGFTWNTTGLQVQFNDTTANVKSNEWLFGDLTGELNIKTPVHTYADAGVYDVKLIVTDSLNCINNTVQQVTVTSVTGINEVHYNSLHLYPNPVRERLFIEHNATDNIAVLSISIFDINGQLIEIPIKMDKELTVIETSTLPSGIYLCWLYMDSIILKQKFIKE